MTKLSKLGFHRLVCGIIFALLAVGCEPEDNRTIVNLGGTTVPDTPGEAIWLEFKRKSEAAAAGRLELRPLIYGQLGSEEQLLSGLRHGRIQFANLSAQVTSTVVPELSLLYAPYLFADEAEADYIYDTYLTDIFTELLAAANLHLVTWYEIGFQSVYGKQPIILPADARGLRFRVSSSLNARLFAEAIGADVIPLGYGEIVSGLQTGLVEAGENSVSLYARTGIADEAPHFTQTRHVFGMSVIVSDKVWWDALSAEDRKILTDSFPSIEESRRLTRAQDAIDLADPALGIQVHPLTADQREEWRKITAGVPEILLESIGGRSREIYELIMRGRSEYAAIN
ncbi:MAG: TRAP transporter substrate-binding protein [Gammaproteobacteria bacterium]|nr:TRAP transporter substrate-binding protein [Gammaproteobacteria bacterium]